MSKPVKTSTYREVQWNKKHIVYTRQYQMSDYVSKHILFINKETFLLEKISKSSITKKFHMHIKYSWGEMPVYIKHMETPAKGFLQIFPQSKNQRIHRILELGWESKRLREYSDNEGNWWHREMLESENPFDLQTPMNILIELYSYMCTELENNPELMEEMGEPFRVMMMDNMKITRGNLELLMMRPKAPAE